MQLKYSILLLFLCITLQGCIKDAGNPSWDIEVSTPLLSTSLSIHNLLPDSLLTTYSDGSAGIIFHYDLHSIGFDTLLKLPDTLLNNSYVFPLTYMAPPGTILFNTKSEKKYDLGDIEITYIKARSGELELKVTNTVERNIFLNYILLSAKLNNTAFNETLTVPPSAQGKEGIIFKTFDATGYTFDMRGTTNRTYNTLLYNSKAWTDPSTPEVLLKPTDSTVIYTKLKNVQIAEARGYFGTKKYTIGPEQTTFNLFKNIEMDALSIEKMNVQLYIENGVGMDAQLILKSLRVSNENNTLTKTLTGSNVNTPINITRARETGIAANPFLPSYTTVNFDNTNFKELIEIIPYQIEYAFDITTNPLGNIAQGNDFLYDHSKIKTSLQIEIPLHLQAYNVVLQDTFALSISNKQLKNIQMGSLAINIHNGFPFNGSLQLLLVNENNQVIDTIMPSTYLASGIMNMNNNVTNSTLTQLTIPLTPERINKLYLTSKIIAKAQLNTAGYGGNVKIYSSYRMDIQLQTNFTYHVNTKKRNE